MKKSKVLVPALGILCLSTAAAVTGTVAWFTAGNAIDIKGMTFTAEAEHSMVIANEGKEEWLTKNVQASHNGEGKSFLSTSTSNFAAWYHGNSDNADNGQSNVEYQTLTVTKPESSKTATGLGVVTAPTDLAEKNIYLLNRFYIQSATQTNLANQDLYVKNLKVEATDEKNADLNKSIRVGFVYGENKTILAPISGATASYTVHGTDAVTAITDMAAETVLNGSTAVTIPAFTNEGASALEVEVYIWFEGEDAHHKSSNIMDTMDALAVSFQLGNKEKA